ncbi:MAG: ABC transporter permease [Clostridiales bacterium]|nr:ABC transporter permease [Clostridiales bacterium]
MGKIYTKLALTSMVNNRAFYVPYIISSGIMAALFFIITSLAFDPFIKTIHGGDTLIDLLSMGIPVIALISLAFIFYISSFIMKRRKKELGLYSVLGMEKKHIIAIISRETGIVAVSSVILGLILGLIFHKISQLFLLKLIHNEADFGFSFPLEALEITVVLFAAIFAAVMIFSAFEILLRSTLGYLKSGSAGEQKPKANWFIGILGIVILAVAYLIASLVTDTVKAFTSFLPAVLLVIVGTYLVFVAGSIMILHILKNNKNYYYKTHNMISVSGMLYRMKRNGMGLATICILSTMVLVMISSVTTVLLLNAENMDKQFPHDFGIEVTPEDSTPEKVLIMDPEVIHDQIRSTASRIGCEEESFNYYYAMNLISVINNGDLTFWHDSGDSEDFYNTYIIDAEDYNRISGENVTIAKGQIGVFSEDIPQIFGDRLSIAGAKEYETVSLPSIPNIMHGESMVYSRGDIYLVLADKNELLEVNNLLKDTWENTIGLTGGPRFLDLRSLSIEFDVSGSGRDFFVEYGNDHLYALAEQELSYMNTNWRQHDNGSVEYLYSKAMFQNYFYSLYGGIFFLGVILSVACITIAVLVMYFKQILEGYEDAGRFSIMKKVGLTNEDIKKTIYSQIVIVFILPLLTAGIHTAFAYKMVKRMLILFGITNSEKYFLILLISVLVFSIFYGIVFFITGRNYFKIVKDADKAHA